ncbi:hypothetical protein ACFWXK_21850 [Streptomyces sp. NPDC059070]|uniref:hypothetical protein n=1 Tax=Streptomyces sp. NPDC059070 TaxID=3346713 RepID=UPI003691CB4D
MAAHSSAPVYQLQLTSASTGVTVAATSYRDPVSVRQPAWYRAARATAPRADPIRHDTTPPPSHNTEGGLQLRRTPDGHIRLGCHISWNADEPF